MTVWELTFNDVLGILNDVIFVEVLKVLISMKY